MSISTLGGKMKMNEESYQLSEGKAKALLEYWPSSAEQEKQRKTVTIPTVFFSILLIFFIGLIPYTLIRYFGNINSIFIHFVIIFPMICLCIFMINFVRHDTVIRQSYLQKAKEIGHEKLISQMTTSSKVFFLDEHDLQSFIVFTDDYAIFPYQKILRWQMIRRVTLSDHYLSTVNKTGPMGSSVSNAAEFLPYKAYKFEYDIQGSKSEIIIKLYPSDLEAFVSFLKDKVPSVTALV